MLGTIDFVIGYMCNLYNTLEVMKVKGSIIPQKNTTVEEYRDEVRKFMC